MTATLSSDAVANVLAFVGPPKEPHRRAWALSLRTLSRTWAAGFGRAARLGWRPVPPRLAATQEPAAVSGRWVDNAAAALFNGDVAALVCLACLDVGVCPMRMVPCLAGRGLVDVLDTLAPFVPAESTRVGGWLATAVADAASNGHAAVLDRLARPPFAATGALLGAATVRAVVCAAAWYGHVSSLDRLALPPFCAGDVFAGSEAEAGKAGSCPVQLAAMGDRVDALDRLARPPYSFGTAAASCAVAHAASVAVLDRLAAPPYAATGERPTDLTAALVRAARHGQDDVVERLTRRPYFATQIDADHGWHAAMRAAAADGHLAVIDRLASPPLSQDRQAAVCSGDTESAFVLAARGGHVAVLDRFTQPPFSLTHDRVKHLICLAVADAAAMGHVAVMDRLAQPPYDGQEGVPFFSRSSLLQGLRRAIELGRVPVLDRLALPPYMLGQADARAVCARAIPVAWVAGHRAAIARLAAHPYSLGEKDFIAGLADHDAARLRRVLPSHPDVHGAAKRRRIDATAAPTPAPAVTVTVIVVRRDRKRKRQH